jgi:hypothetical protein
MKCHFCGWEINDASTEHHIIVNVSDEMRHYQLPADQREWRWVACSLCAEQMFAAAQRAVETAALRIGRKMRR